MRKILLDPLFLLGLAVRLALVFTVAPQPVTEWYVPFLEASTRALGADPWAHWLAQGGAPSAFPYGYAMWLVFLPLALLFKELGLSLIYGHGLTLIGADLALCFLLNKMIPGRRRLLLAIYWQSPIVIMASYLFGYNDLVPVLFLGAALYCVRQSRFLVSGLALLAAISAKLSMLLAVPLFLIYLLHNRALRQFLPRFVKGMALGALVLLLPFLVFSPAGVNMLFSNPEMGKIYRLGIHLDDITTIYLVPLVYLLMLYAVWRIRRLNFELFNAMLGMAFLLVVLMTPASPGWFIWAVPLLVAYQVASGRAAIALVALFSLLYVLSNLLLTSNHAVLSGKLLGWLSLFAGRPEQALAALPHTMMVATGLILALRIWRETVSRNDYFRLSRKPFVLGVAGDSGAGKDTFSDAIKGLFGAHSVATLSGDDYHLWDRQKPMWQVMTHLNPMANHLEGFAHDLVALIDGKRIHSRHYDHQSGRMSRPSAIQSNDIIIASGLHALYLPILRECYNLSIYLDIDEGLRRHFKIRRDVNQRGHSLERVLSSFERREPDAVRFIRPQAANADLVLSLQPIHSRILLDVNEKHPLRFKLVVRSRHGFSEMSLMRALIGVAGLHVDLRAHGGASGVELTIEGESSGQDIALAAQMVCPRIFEFLDIYPKWQDGVMGLMQLVTLSHIDQALTRRFI